MVRVRARVRVRVRVRVMGRVSFSSVRSGDQKIRELNSG